MARHNRIMPKSQVLSLNPTSLLIWISCQLEAEVGEMEAVGIVGCSQAGQQPVKEEEQPAGQAQHAHHPLLPHHIHEQLDLPAPLH